MANQAQYYNIVSKENFNDDVADALMASFDIHEVDIIEELPRFLTELWKRNWLIAPRPGVVIEENVSLWFLQIEKQPEELAAQVQQYDRKMYFGNPLTLFQELEINGVVHNTNGTTLKLISHDESIVITATQTR